MKKEEVITKRKFSGLSQRQLAFKSGISRYRLSDFECGYLDLKEEEVSKISKILEVEKVGGKVEIKK